MPSSPTDLPFRRALARRIIAGRKSVGLTQGELAAALGTSRSRVSAWEGGESFPPLDVVWALAKRIRVKLGDLLAPPEVGLPLTDDARRRGRPRGRSNRPAPPNPKSAAGSARADDATKSRLSPPRVPTVAAGRARARDVGASTETTSPSASGPIHFLPAGDPEALRRRAPLKEQEAKALAAQLEQGLHPPVGAPVDAQAKVKAWAVAETLAPSSRNYFARVARLGAPEALACVYALDLISRTIPSRERIGALNHMLAEPEW